MKKAIAYTVIVLVILLLFFSSIYLPRIFHETPIDDMTVETVDFEDSESVVKYLHSLYPLSQSNQASNESSYPSISNIQYVFLWQQANINRSSVLIDYPQKKVIFDSHYNVVSMYPRTAENIRDLTEEDVKNIGQLLDDYDIFHWKIDYDGRHGEEYGDYESFWLITIVFDDGSVFQTGGAGDYEEGWPDKYHEFKDDLFALAES